jgi:Fe-S cluster assembly iron-binding protein IscA
MKGMTDVAGEQLKAALDETKAPEEKAIRLLMTEHGAELKLDRIRESDQVFEHDDRKVLVLDPPSAEATSESTLDYHEGQYRFV